MKLKIGKTLTRIIAGFICATFVLSAVSCGKKDENVEDTDVNTETGEVSDGEISDEIGENELGIPKNLRFDGETFNMYIAYSASAKQFKADEPSNDLLLQKCYERNEAVKDRLGIEFNIVGSTLTTSGADQRTETDKISSLILAGDKTYDAFLHVQHTGMPTLINEGMFIDWNTLPYIDIEKPWWYSNAIRDITFGNKIFAMTGDYNLGTFTNTECLIFNKNLMDELELEYPYQAVLDGTWTHDMFVEYIQKATKDLNGDGQMDIENDRYGFNGWEYEQIPALYVGYGGETLKKDDNGLPVLNIYSVKQNEIIDAMIKVFANPGATWESNVGSNYRGAFSSGKLLFVDGFFHHLQGYSDMEDDFGFVPYPKLNEAQERYYSRSANIGCLTYIPVTLDPDRYELVGATLETWAYEGSEIVLPTYYDIVLTIKSTRDMESEQMIPIIKDSAKFMDQAIGFSPTSFVKSGQNTLSSHWMSNKSNYEEKLETLIKVYQ